MSAMIAPGRRTELVVMTFEIKDGEGRSAQAGSWGRGSASLRRGSPASCELCEDGAVLDWVSERSTMINNDSVDTKNMCRL